MDYKKAPRIFIIGFMGSDRKGVAEKLAGELGYEVLDLEIEREDGRSIQRICMMMGEHEYRNKEYEMLLKLADMERIVAVCGDGVVLDDMNRGILEQNAVIVADTGLKPDALWERVKGQTGLPYAFMQQKDDILRKETFIALYHQRKPLYNQFVDEMTND